jgi:hypothetical protein
MMEKQPIVVAGAGAIGCFVGGLLAARGYDVTLLARRRVMDQISEHGLHLTDFAGLNVDVPAENLTLTDDPDCLQTEALVLVTVKTADTAAMAQEIGRNAPKDAVVISLQNGLEAAQTLRDILPSHDVSAGMVPFNVVPAGPGSYHRSTSGNIVIEAGKMPLADHLSHPDLVFENSNDIAAVQWGKLLINLNNAPLRIQPDYQHDPERKLPQRYLVSRDITVSLNDLSLYSTVLQQAADLGVTQMNQAEFLVSESDELYQKALQQAFAHAKTKATLLAKANGLKLGSAQKINEQGYAPAPVMKMARAMADGAEVSFGQTDIRAEVSVEFEMNSR